MMKFLHTSDWHIGRNLHGRRRHDETQAFLSWLEETIRRREIDALLVAGDVFDSIAPGNTAQGLYYRFLSRLAATPCRHVVVIGGNHDSPSFLNAPRELLKALDVHVVGCATDGPAAEVLVLRTADGAPELIVCAVPFLRDRDVRTVEAGETAEDKNRKLVEGIAAHYRQVGAIALAVREDLLAAAPSANVPPIVGMGHLFTEGGRTVDDDGVRELYVGSLAHVAPGGFPDCFDYIALGHLHVAQTVNGAETIRYSGSPMPMGFGEAGQRKRVVLVEFPASGGGAGPADSALDASRGPLPRIECLDVPEFQTLESIKGDWDAIAARLAALAAAGSTAWVEVVYEGDEVLGDLGARLDAAVANTRIEILRVKNTRRVESVLGRIQADETLEDLDAEEVFRRCLDQRQVPEEQRADLLMAYREIEMELKTRDVNEA